jgi:HSP20 family protein
MPPEPGDAPLWVPRADVLINSAGELVIKLELAALRKEDLEITVDGQRLTFAGHRADPDADGARHLISELDHGRFEVVIEAPPEFDLHHATAAYQNGLLRVVAPRRSGGRWTGTL